MKDYFDDTDEEEGGSPESVDKTSFNADHIMLGLPAPKTKDDLLNMLPDKAVMDRLIVRYFSSYSPSQRMSLPDAYLQTSSLHPYQILYIAQPSRGR